MRIRNKLPLGQLLIEEGLITSEQLQIALKEQQKTGELLGITLVRLGFVGKETVILPVVARQLDVDLVDLKTIAVSKELLNRIPAKLANHYKIFPVKFNDKHLCIAMSNPLDIQTIDEIELMTKSKIVPALANEQDIVEAIRRYYGLGAETIERMMHSVNVRPKHDMAVEQIDDIGSEASISKFLNQILLEAYKDRATDIHIEPFEDELKIRYRIDGVLYDAKVPSNVRYFQDSIISRIKIMSNLNIAEKRLPQDGRFKVRVGNQDLDLRVSFIPTPHGESVVMRVLNSIKLYSLEDLGLSDQELNKLDQLIKKPYGIIFVTGPTGSGKTTTLYSCLSRVNKDDRKILTIEDPVEYQLKGITQIQIHPQIGLTFAAGLRSMLRHDPDIMMVGEVRDFETAQITIQVALTGHLVFSTLHTNDAASAIARLSDMGIEPYLISSSVECFIAQRLVRIICPYCKHSAEISSEILRDFGIQDDSHKSLQVHEGKGCERCRFTGYSGREAIYEFLMLTEDIRQMIVARATASQIKEKAMAQGMRTLRQHGWEKVLLGKTTASEVLRVTHEDIL